MRELRKEEKTIIGLIKKSRGIDKVRAGFYARKSREDETGMSLLTQIDECRKFVENNDYLIEYQDQETYKEDEASGMFIDKRVELLKLLKQVKEGKIDVVIASKGDRISRDSINTSLIEREIEEAGAFLILLDETGDKSASGIFSSQILRSAGEFQVRRSVEDVMKVHSNIVKAGKTCGGPGNYGYNIENRKYVINVEEALGVNIVFDMFLEGKSYTDITNELDFLDIKPRKSLRFSHSTIHSILTNSRNCGISVWNSHAKRKERPRVLKEIYDEVISEVVVEKNIISKAKFNRVQEIIGQRTIGKVNKGKPRFLLTSLIECNFCHFSMIGKSQIGGRAKKQYRSYQCKNHKKKHATTCSTKQVNAEYLEKYVKETILKILNVNFKGKGIPSSTSNAYFKNDDIVSKRLKREITDHESLLSKMTLGMYKATSKVVIKATENEIEKLDKIISRSKAKIINLKTKKAKFKLQQKQYSSGKLKIEDVFINDEITMRIIRQFVKKIYLDNNNIEIELY